MKTDPKEIYNKTHRFSGFKNIDEE